jgi:quinol monooxygenase YgiN
VWQFLGLEREDREAKNPIPQERDVAGEAKIAGVREIRGEEMEGAVEQYVFVRLHAREGEESAVEEALREVTGPSREEVGCLSFHTFRSMRDRRLFFIHSRWVGEAAFQKHAELPHTVRFLERVDALLDQPRDVTRTEMIE